MKSNHSAIARLTRRWTAATLLTVSAASNSYAQANLFNNPFNKLSAHHRPIGAGAVAGIPGGTLNPTATNPTYDAPGAINSRGRLANVTLFRCSSDNQGRKYIYLVESSDPNRTINDEPGAPANNKLPFTSRMPNDVTYPSTTGDDNVILWPRNGNTAGDMADLFFNFEDSASTAKFRREYKFAGTDIADGSDSWDKGSSASGLRWPGTVLRGVEINQANPAPIHHALNVAATRHSNAGAPATAHILSKKMVWPAYSKDGGADDPGANTGDLPYGTRIFIRWADRGLRDTLGLSARGKVLFDTLLYYGFYIVDGTGAYSGSGAQLQLRIDQDVTSSTVTDLNAQLAKILPHRYPLRNPRKHNTESELQGGLPYAGSGGPLPTSASGAGSINNAWDAPTSTTVTFYSIDAEDGHINESSETSNQGGSVWANPQLGDTPTDSQKKVIVSFDTASIPDGATIQSVELRLRRASITGTNPFTLSGFTPCKVDYRAGGFNGNTALEAADFQAAATTSNVVSAGMSNPTANETDSIGSVATSAVNKTGRTQYRIYFSKDDNDNNSADYVLFYGGDATGDQRPRLIVTYQ